MELKDVFFECTIPTTGVLFRLRGNTTVEKIGAVFSCAMTGMHELGHAIAGYFLKQEISEVSFQGSFFTQKAAILFKNTLDKMDSVSGLICMAGPLFNSLFHTIGLTQIAFQKNRTGFTSFRKNLHQWLLTTQLVYSLKSYIKNNKGDCGTLSRNFPTYAKITASTLLFFKLLDTIYNEPECLKSESRERRIKATAQRFGGDCFAIFCLALLPF